jgi:glycosyltransferase involved in cell wall biosynthesis
MKIAFVSDSIYPYNKGGKEKRLYEISIRLSKMGHDVHIYTMHWWDSREKTITENGVTLHAISKRHEMYKGDRRSISEGVLFALACFKLINIDFDVIDVDHMPFFPIFSAWIVCKLKRKKLNGTWHEALRRSDWVDYMGVIGNIAAIIERIAIRLPYTVTASSEHTLELIRTELKRNKRLELVTAGIDISSIQKVAPSSLSSDILFVGRLVKDKNVTLLIKAIAVLKEQGQSIHCLIVGSGIEEDNIKRSIKKYGLENNVQLIGNLPHANDIYGLMKMTKVLALPSKREGFGIVALEALACGTPVITTNLPANAAKQLIDDGVDGSIIFPKQYELAEAILEWINKDPEQEVIAGKIDKFDWKNLVNKQLEAYGV